MTSPLLASSIRSWRRLLGSAALLKPKVSVSEVIRLLALGGQGAILTYAPRPADFIFTRLECPSCLSISTAKVCRHCGLARQSKTDVRAWNGSSRYCTTWTAEQNKACRRIVPAEIWERGLAASTALSRDPGPVVHSLAPGSVSSAGSISSRQHCYSPTDTAVLDLASLIPTTRATCDSLTLSAALCFTAPSGSSPITWPSLHTTTSTTLTASKPTIVPPTSRRCQALSTHSLPPRRIPSYRSASIAEHRSGQEGQTRVIPLLGASALLGVTRAAVLGSHPRP